MFHTFVQMVPCSTPPSHVQPADVWGGEEQEGSLAGPFAVQDCGLLAGGLNHPGVRQDSLNGQSVHRVVLQQAGNQVFGSSTDIGL